MVELLCFRDISYYAETLNMQLKCCQNNTNLNTVQYPNICSGTRTIFLIKQLRGKNLGVRWLVKNQQLWNKK